MGLRGVPEPYPINIDPRELLNETWYEMIYRGAPFFDFEKDCIGSIAYYDNYQEIKKTFRVTNTCIKGNGNARAVTGTAKVISSGKLFVEFPESAKNPFLKMQEREGNYWIIDYNNVEIDEMGSKAKYIVIASPDGYYAWILTNKLDFFNSPAYTKVYNKYNMLFVSDKYTSEIRMKDIYSENPNLVENAKPKNNFVSFNE